MSSPSSELSELYREMIADHAKQPRNFREIPQADHRAQGHNRACGDKFTVWVKVTGGVIDDISFKGSGCAISSSSASMMTEATKGLTLEAARALFEQFHALLTGNADAAPDTDDLGKLIAFAGVKKFPIRVKCATLPWHTLRAALDARERFDVEIK
jgi:nitrogen fixation NifU-like protein